jgi:hypothetical protein
MKETSASAMAPWFERWCYLMMYLLNKAQRREFRHNLGG